MSDMREFFRATAERVFVDAVTPKDIAACEQRTFPAALFAALAETGISSMLASEEHGGVGASVADAVAIMRIAGAAAAPGPVLETLFANALFSRAGLAAPGGPVALAFMPDAEPPEPGASVWPAPTAFHQIPWGGLAEHFVVVASVGSDVRLIATRPSDWTIEPGADAAGEPRDRLSGAGVPVQVAELPAANLESLLSTAAILRSGQMLGAVEWAFRRTADYAMERQQFGRALGKFQIVQQLLAELADHTLAAAVITETAAESMSPTLVGAARSRLADAADAAISIAHQVHGAIGFSREYALNHRTRRLMAWRDDYGSVTSWRRTLGAAYAGLSREELWPALLDPGLLQIGA